MIFRHNHTLIVVSLFAVISGTPAAAYEIFQWVDRDGVTHYSQWEPSADTAEVTRLELITANPTNYDPETNHYSIRNQAVRTNEMYQRIEERRAARAAERAEAAEREAQAQAQTITYYEPMRRYVLPVLLHKRPHKRFHGHHWPPDVYPNQHRSRDFDDFDRHRDRQPSPGRRSQEQRSAKVGGQRLHWAPPRPAQ